MTVRIGVIADDLTGATDIAGFLAANGLRTVQLNGASPEDAADARTRGLSDTDAIVIGLKSRSLPAAEAVSLSRSALAELRAAGAERIIFKYCSTFDSTPAGNIGPVADALLAELDSDFTVVCPALPVNGRTVYQGNLFVWEQPLHESGMRHHPVTPMTDANLVRLLGAQTEASVGLVPHAVIDAGPEAVRARLKELRAEGVRYAVLDCVSDRHLDVIGEAVIDLPLVTGGSGIGAGLARAVSEHTGAAPAAQWQPLAGRTVVLSGSSSSMTNRQVARYRELAPSWPLDVARLLDAPGESRAEVLDWVRAQSETGPAPLVFATAAPEQVRALQDAHGAELTRTAIEAFFGALAVDLAEHGFHRFIVAGGESSGAVTEALGVSGFALGPQIAPGVPWVRSLDGALDLALKSGNFGAEDFFARAQGLANTETETETEAEDHR